jgi:hypothetical protein
MCSSFLKKYGKTLLNDNAIFKRRQKFIWDIDLTSQKEIENFIKELLFLDVSTKIMLDIRQKELGPGLLFKELKWHMDDHQLVKLKKTPTYNINLYKHISGKNYLYCCNSLARAPDYTLIFYQSTQGNDFEGGELLLADDTKIIPCNHEGIIIDSQEIHCVLPVKKGIRYSTIVKVFL